MLSVRGGTEAFAAWSDEPIAKHTRVVVVEGRSARSVTVTPVNAPPALPRRFPMLFWKVPAPDEALLISGSKHKDGTTQFRIVTGPRRVCAADQAEGALLSLALREAELVEECVTKQGIPLQLRAVAIFKVGDDTASIANAARRFLAEQNRMEELCGRIFAGHLRSIVGSLTVEEIIRERDRVAQEVKEGSHSEMEKLGIVVDGLQIQEIEDPTGYIKNLAAPHAAAVASAARIAAAERDQEATEKEQQAERAKAQFARETSIAQAQIEAEVQEAQARRRRRARWPRRGPRRT